MKMILESGVFLTESTPKYERRRKFTPCDPNVVEAFMAGVVNEVFVRAGESVAEGEPLFVVESMKMKNTIYSTKNGVVCSVNVSVGQAVSKGMKLLEFEQSAY